MVVALRRLNPPVLFDVRRPVTVEYVGELQTMAVDSWVKYGTEASPKT